MSRTLYDNKSPDKVKFKSIPGINQDLIKQISRDKKEPEWMLKKRLEGLKIFLEKPMPNFGPDLSNLDFNEISFYVKPNAKKNSKKWEDVPKEIKDTFDRLGIPEAEKKALAGVGAQYESEIIYHNMKQELADQGVVFMDMDEAVKKYPNLVKRYFMTTCVSPDLHKFTALHSAVWSGGTFIYVPKGITVELPLQAYFRMNTDRSGQFEHTLIIADEGSTIHYIEGCSAPLYEQNSLHAGCVEIHVKQGAHVRYSSIENWSKNVYNLNTKRGIVEEDGILEWVNGNLGSKVTMLYPSSVLVGNNSKTDYIGIAYAGKGQYQDTGCKVYHLGKNTSSNILSKSISLEGGTASYRGLVNVKPNAKNSISHVRCDGLMLDDQSKSFTDPAMKIEENDVSVSHEASVGKISEDQLFYLMSRGLSKEEATKMIINGFIEPLINELPMEYAVELNRLIEMEIENSII